MNKFNAWLKRNREALNTRTAHVGGYSFLMSLLVLAILIGVNIAVKALPTKLTQFDISAARLYSVTSSTKAVAQNLDRDVTIYWITQSGEEDSVLEKLLNVYDDLSDHISVVKKNPDIYPTFAAQYTDETVKNNSLIVESGDKYRYIAYSDIYQTDTSTYYTTGSISQSFDGEGAITTAIDYVVSDDLPVLYVLTGHGEADLSDTFTSALAKQNIETESLSLLTVDEIPEDAAAVLVYAPANDISEKETEMLQDYLSDGGKLMVISGPQEDQTMENLHGLLENYGITTAEGIVVEGDRTRYAFGAPYVLLPELGDSDITTELSANNSYIVIPIAEGLDTSDAVSSAEVTDLLTTSSDSYAKTAGYAITTYDKEEGDTDGPFTVAAAITDKSGGELIWIATDYIMDDTYNSYSSGANSDFTMNAVSELIGETESISIRSKSLDNTYLTISTSQATLIKTVLIAVIPLLYLAFGIEDVIVRKKNCT